MIVEVVAEKKHAPSSRRSLTSVDGPEELKTKMTFV